MTWFVIGKIRLFFCYGDEEDRHHIYVDGYLTTANQLIKLAKRVLSLSGLQRGH